MARNWVSCNRSSNLISLHFNCGKHKLVTTITIGNVPWCSKIELKLQSNTYSEIPLNVSPNEFIN
jgi:hypothetical protein